MSMRSDRAVEVFQNGFSCSQAVVVVFADILKIDESILLRISSGFGAGMGKLQKTCGAITGAFMVISYLYGFSDEKDVKQKGKVYGIVKDFSDKFSQYYNDTDCIELLGCNLNSEEGKKKFNDDNLNQERCSKFIEDAVKILEDIILNNSKLQNKDV